MIESWRSYGPLDMITLPEVAQTRANGIVTAPNETRHSERSGQSVTFALVKP